MKKCIKIKEGKRREEKRKDGVERGNHTGIRVCIT
jgi:hypothetical protein